MKTMATSKGIAIDMAEKRSQATDLLSGAKDKIVARMSRLDWSIALNMMAEVISQPEALTVDRLKVYLQLEAQLRKSPPAASVEEPPCR